MSGWLYRNLEQRVDELVVCDPRRNKLICSDGDSDERAELKHWVNLYHDRVRDAVRHINKIRARCRMFGRTISESAVRDPAHRLKWLFKYRIRAVIPK